ncbi:MAG: NUDIX hydrolase [Parcubacteria group bacterium]|nr:MAG: NUDIX hydrolase [Parcubacteria group bacterium]
MIKPLPRHELKKLYNSFPRKRIAAGALFLNRKGELLLVKPCYRPFWSIPGGVAEKDESPFEACQRECKEEINIRPKKLRLLCLDYKNTFDIKPESMQLIFYGGRLSIKQISRIKADRREITGHKFVSLNRVYKTLGGKHSDLAKRIKYCFLAIKNKKVYYLENGNLK